jgi:hypothetical protein
MPRSILGGELSLIQSDHFETYGRLTIDGTPVESVLGYDPLLSATWTADIDQLVQQASFRLHLGLGSETTSPLMSTGPTLGLGLGGPRPLFDVGRRIALQTACIPPGGLADTGDWHTVFDGLIDDHDPASESSDDVLTLTARDLMSAVLDDWVQPSLTVPETLLQEPGGLMADVLHHLFGSYDYGFYVAGSSLVGMDNIFLAIEGDPQFTILPYTQAPGSRLEIMRQIGLQNGWDLRGRFGTGIDGADMFVLTYYDPDRSKLTPDWTFGPDQYFTVRSLRVSRNNVRNTVRSTPVGDRASPAQVLDNPSVLLYGRRYMELSEDQWSHIDTHEEALALANYALSDLKEPKATMEVDLPYFWPLELNDLVRFEANSVHHDQPIDLAVTGFTHTLFEDGNASTVIQTRGKPAAANREWRYNPPKMQFVSYGEPVGIARPGAVWLRRVT